MIAAIYARKSTNQEGVSEEARSVTRQVENARKFAASKGWTVKEEFIFTDDGISGAETSRLRARTRMIELAKQRAFPIVVMQAQDRSPEGMVTEPSPSWRSFPTPYSLLSNSGKRRERS